MSFENYKQDLEVSNIQVENEFLRIVERDLTVSKTRDGNEILKIAERDLTFKNHEEMNF